MLGSSPIMAFVATKDPVRAKTFYQDVPGLNFVADEPFALVFEANGTMLRVSKVREINPAPYTVLGWKVTSPSPRFVISQCLLVTRRNGAGIAFLGLMAANGHDYNQFQLNTR